MPVTEKSSTRVHFLQYSCQLLEMDLPADGAPPSAYCPVNKNQQYCCGISGWSAGDACSAMKTTTPQ